jgi:hypothetical protein
VVQLLLWKHPVEPGGFLVLKAPQISRHVAQFAEVFPEARFLITDRDPYRCIVSLAVLGHAIVEWFCEINPLTDDGHRSKISSEQVPSKLGEHRRLHDGCTVTCAARLVPRSSCALPSTSSERRWKRTPPTMSCPPRWSRTSNASRRANGAAPPAALHSMGYDQADVWGDPVIRSYCERFGIEPERTRLTGAAPAS